MRRLPAFGAADRANPRSRFQLGPGISRRNGPLSRLDSTATSLVQYMPDGWTARAYGKFMSDQEISKHMMHAGIVVTHLDSELRFYEDILGFKERWRGSHSGTQLSWVNAKVPDGDDYVEFMLFKEPPAPTQGGTAHHIAAPPANPCSASNEFVATLTSWIASRAGLYIGLSVAYLLKLRYGTATELSRAREEAVSSQS